MSLIPGAEPYSADGGEIGVLLSHGFTGTPASMRPWGEYLAAAGYTVRVPLLPGHGTRWQDCNRTGWQDWYATIERTHDELATRCEKVFACGLSMGGTLVTRLAEERPDGVAGLVLVNPSYATERLDAKLAPYVAWALPSRPGIGGDVKKPGVAEPAYDRTPIRAFASLQRLWSVVLRDMGRITAPIRLYRSAEDHVVEPLSSRLLLTRTTGADVEEIILTDSYHVATLDYDAEKIFAGSAEFMRGVLSRSEDTATP